MAPTFQVFKSQDDEPLAQILRLSCPETGKKYVLWEDVQRELPGVDYLWLESRRWRIQYMIDRDAKV